MKDEIESADDRPATAPHVRAPLFAYGDHAYADIALGKTKAVGAVFAATEPTAGDKVTALQFLDEIVPAWYAWGKAIVKIVLRV